MSASCDQIELLDNQFLDLPTRIEVDITKQTLALIENDSSTLYSISTAKNGPGQLSGSGCTPLGHHVIRAKIGQGSPIGSVFVGRRETGEIYSPALARRFPQRDWILTRILWLSGLQIGYNRLSNVDSMRRYIYIHGTPDTEAMGTPCSHGCIRMRNNELIEFFSRVAVGTRVLVKI